MGYEIKNKETKNDVEEIYGEKDKIGKAKPKWYLSYPILILTLVFCLPCSFSLSIVRLLMVKNSEKGYKIRSILAVGFNSILMILSISMFFSSPNQEIDKAEQNKQIEMESRIGTENEAIDVTEEMKAGKEKEQKAKAESESIKAEKEKSREESEKRIRESIRAYKENKTKKYIQEIQEEDEDLVWNVLKENILQSFSPNISEAQRIADIKEYCGIYEDAFAKANEESSEMKKNLQRIEDLNSKISQIEKKYSFSIKDNISAQTRQWYVSQRLSYGNDIVDALDSMISDGSDWIAYDIVYLFDSPFPGDNCVILHSEELNPFSYSGAYTLDCILTSKTQTLVDGNGFQHNVPVYDIINIDLFMADRESIIEAEYQIEQLWRDIQGKYQESYQSYSGAQTVNSGSDYILPDSSSRYLAESDLMGLDKSTLRLARNEIYARHGRIFQTEDLNAYFRSKSWYNGYLSADEFNDSVFNEYEKANLELIKMMEN